MTEKRSAVFKNLSSDRNGTTAEGVVACLRDMIHSGQLSAGDKLPPERDLAKFLGISRPTLRAGIRSLSAVGMLRSKQGSGTFVASAEEPIKTDSSPLRTLSVLQGFTSDEMFEARLALETSTAGLAAQRVTSDQMKTLAEEMEGMDASLNDPEKYLDHDTRFHQIVASASGNRIMAALIDIVATTPFENRSKTMKCATDLKDSAERHHNIYEALRGRDSQAAEKAMREHLIETQKARHMDAEGNRNGLG